MNLLSDINDQIKDQEEKNELEDQEYQLKVQADKQRLEKAKEEFRIKQIQAKPQYPPKAPFEIPKMVDRQP